MTFQRFFRPALLGSSLLLGGIEAGCDAPQADEYEEIDEQAQAVESGDPDIFIVSLNSLPPGLLTDPEYQAKMAALAGGPVDTMSTLADTRAGRTLLGYIAVCAIAEGNDMVVTATNGSRYRFTGHLGLAPGWRMGALTASGERWVSACLLAHANSYGAPVMIDVRGDHPALAAPPAAGFTEQEAAFYGNVFHGGDTFACIGSSSSHPEGTPDRICGRTADCGFTITGTCLPDSEQPACLGGPETYRACETGAPGVTVDEVITIYTEPGTFGNPPVCPHPPDEEGWPLAKTCSAVAEAVCEADAYCCEVAWDTKCVDLAKTPGIGF